MQFKIHKIHVIPQTLLQTISVLHARIIKKKLLFYPSSHYAPVTMASAAMQEKAEMSMFMLCKLEENSTMASTHSPKPRTHCSLCNTTPLQKISFPSTGLDLQLMRGKNAFNYAP